MKSSLIFVAALIFFVLISPAGAQENDFQVLKGPYLGQEPPGGTPVVFAPGIVSTGREHSAAMFTPDGNEVWFARLFPAAIYYMKLSDGTWTYPRIASFCDTSTTSLYPVISPDGNQIFFSSDLPMDRQGIRLTRGDYHIWMVEKKAGKWSDPEHLDANVNFGRRQSCGGVAANGDLYFASFVDRGSMDIFKSELRDGRYGNPVALTELNSPAPDHCPFIAPDGSYLIFSSFQGGMGRSDLFISFRGQDGNWSRPKNMGPTINSAFKDEYPYVTPDGKYLFFNSNRPSLLNQTAIEDGPGNIYWVDSGIIERLRSDDGSRR